MRTSACFVLAAIMATSAASVASAAPVSAAIACSVVDVSFRGSNADQCYGEVVGTNDSLSLVNSLGVFGGGWADMVRDNGAEGTRLYAGVNWTLRADVDERSGDWQLLLQDPAPANLPLSVDFMVVLKGGNDWSGYLFSAEKFYPTDLVNNGAFAISFKNNGGNIPELSHMSLYFRNGASFDCAPTDPKCPQDPPCQGNDCPGDTVPEPTSMALLGLGLLGAGIVGRRKK